MKKKYILPQEFSEWVNDIDSLVLHFLDLVETHTKALCGNRIRKIGYYEPDIMQTESGSQSGVIFIQNHSIQVLKFSINTNVMVSLLTQPIQPKQTDFKVWFGLLKLTLKGILETQD